MASLLSFFPVIEALLSFAISAVLFKKWWSTGDKSTKFWAWAFLFHFMSYLIAGFFVSRLVVLQVVQYFLLQFARQTFESLLFLSVYFGIINLLTTKRSLTFTLPFLFFIMQELILLYFDFFIKDLRLADQLHIVFFDIPFNILVALLFWKYYSVSKKKYASLIAAGWALYAVFVPIFFYTEGNVLLYTISLSHIIIMFTGFVLLYESPTGQAILEITPAVEKRLSTAMKYRLKPGKTYLVEEETPEKSYDIFMDAVLHGIRGLVVTRTKPELVQKKFELQVTPVLWLTHVQSQLSTVDPSEPEQFVFLVEKFVNSAKEQALTEGEVPPPVQPETKEVIEEKQIPKPIEEKPPAPQKPMEEKPVEEKKPEEKQSAKPEEEWKQKMKETIAEVKVISKKPIVLGEEAAEKPLKEVVKEAEKAGVEVAIEAKPAKKGVMLVLEEEKGEEKPVESIQQPAEQKKESPPAEKAEEKPQDDKVKSEEKKEENKSEKQRVVEEKKVREAKEELPAQAAKKEQPQETELAEKPLKELVKEAEKLGSVEIKGKPSGGGIEIKRGKILILDDEEEKKDIKTKASFILAAGNVDENGGTGLNKSIVMIDGFEYLVSNNAFTAVLHMLQTLKDKISMGESMLIIPVNPKCFDEKEMSMLRMEFEIYVEEKE